MMPERVPKAKDEELLRRVAQELFDTLHLTSAEEPHKRPGSDQLYTYNPMDHGAEDVLAANLRVCGTDNSNRVVLSDFLHDLNQFNKPEEALSNGDLQYTLFVMGSMWRDLQKRHAKRSTSREAWGDRYTTLGQELAEALLPHGEVTALQNQNTNPQKLEHYSIVYRTKSGEDLDVKLFVEKILCFAADETFSEDVVLREWQTEEVLIGVLRGPIRGIVKAYGVSKV